jgi:hypothetical protein
VIVSAALTLDQKHYGLLVKTARIRNPIRHVGINHVTMVNPMKVILEGIVGSKAYGLDTPESDTDTRGCFVLPTRDILGLRGYTDTIDSIDPDRCLYEVSKFMKLAKNANPNVLEILYLPKYTEVSEEGKLILGIRSSFLSQKVRATYAGYAMSQVKRLQNREDGSFKSKLRKRYEKHARHIFRLMQQGMQILEHGTLTVRVPNPDELFAIGKLPPEELIKRFEEEDAKLREVKSSLPEEPDLETINGVLLAIRDMNYKWPQ